MHSCLALATLETQERYFFKYGLQVDTCNTQPTYGLQVATSSYDFCSMKFKVLPSIKRKGDYNNWKLSALLGNRRQSGMRESGRPQNSTSSLPDKQVAKAAASQASKSVGLLNPVSSIVFSTKIKHQTHITIVSDSTMLWAQATYSAEVLYHSTGFLLLVCMCVRIEPRVTLH